MTGDAGPGFQVGPLGLLFVVDRRGDRQHAADRLDPNLVRTCGAPHRGAGGSRVSAPGSRRGRFMSRSFVENRLHRAGGLGALETHV